MKKMLLLLTLIASASLFVACTASNGPEAVAKQAITAIQKGDYDAYAATFDLSESDQKMLSGMVESKVKEGIDSKGGIKSFNIVDSTVNEDTAQVKVHLVYKDGSEDDQTMDFKKVDDKWKQVMNK